VVIQSVDVTLSIKMEGRQKLLLRYLLLRDMCCTVGNAILMTARRFLILWDMGATNQYTENGHTLVR
jgi:hypothetical protein